MESSKNKLRKGIITCPEFVEVAGSIAVADAELNPAHAMDLKTPDHASPTDGRR